MVSFCFPYFNRYEESTIEGLIEYLKLKPASTLKSP
jgi:hypothetical protein